MGRDISLYCPNILCTTYRTRTHNTNDTDTYSIPIYVEKHFKSRDLSSIKYNLGLFSLFFPLVRQLPPPRPSGPGPPHSWGFKITHNDAPQTAGLLSVSDHLVAETSYLTTHNTHNRQTSIFPAGFEPTISAGERPQTYALDRAATGTGIRSYTYTKSNFRRV